MLLRRVAAEFRGFIETSIPHIIDLLKDNDKDVRSASVAVLSKFSEHGM
jgi:HEAT repeat protein